MKTICFDLDGVICTNTWGKYEDAKPIISSINKVNELYRSGYRIIIFTARYMGRNNEDPNKAIKMGYNFTQDQLKKWNVNYHKLIFGKPSYDLIVDDKSIFFQEDWVNNLFIKNE